MPIVKWFFGFAWFNSSNTALTIAGVNSFDAQPVSPANHARHRGKLSPASISAFRSDRSDNVLIERLAGAARLLCAIQNGDRLNRSAAESLIKCVD